MKLEVIAEGVETQEQADFLIASGCEKLQGYLFSRPQPGERIELMLRERHGRHGVPGAACANPA